MAAANESQGLKIAVACVHRTVGHLDRHFVFPVLGLFVGRRQAGNRPTTRSRTRAKTANLAVTQLRRTARQDRHQGTGSRPGQGRDQRPLQEGRRADRQDGGASRSAAVEQGPGKGRQGPELEEYKQNVQKIIASFRSEPNKNYISSLDRLAELMENVALLSTELSVNYLTLRQVARIGRPHVNKEQVRRADQGRHQPPRRRPGRTEQARRRAEDPARAGREAQHRQRQQDHRDHQPDQGDHAGQGRLDSQRSRP